MQMVIETVVVPAPMLLTIMQDAEKFLEAGGEAAGVLPSVALLPLLPPQAPVRVTSSSAHKNDLAIMVDLPGPDSPMTHGLRCGPGWIADMMGPST